MPRLPFDAIDVSFDPVEDPSERRRFMKMPPTFFLPAGSLDRLRELGGRLLRNSRPYKILLERIARARETRHSAVRESRGALSNGIGLSREAGDAAEARMVVVNEVRKRGFVPPWASLLELPRVRRRSRYGLVG